jgi:hypothetical protein
LKTVLDLFVYHTGLFIGVTIATLYFLRLGWLYVFNRKQYQKETSERESSHTIPWEAADRERPEYVIVNNPKEKQK